MATAQPRQGAQRRGRRRRRRRGPRGGLAAILASGLFALSLLAIVVPRLLAVAQVAGYGDVSDRLGSGELAGGALAKAISDHRAALTWSDNGRHRGDLGQLYFAAARSYADDPARRSALLEQAARNYEDALSRDPGQPFLWTQLAIAQAQISGMDARFAGILRLAIEVAPRTPRLVFSRADLGIRAWPRLDAHTRALVKEQIVQAARLDPKRLGRSIPGPNHRRLVRHLLADDPALLQRFLRP